MAINRMRIGALLAVMLIVSMAFVSAASAQSDKNKLKQIDPYTYGTDGKVTDKEKFVDKIDPILDRKHNVSSPSTGDVTSQSFDTSKTTSYTKDVLGSSIEVRSNAHGVQESGIIWATYTGDGYTKGYWWGSGNADRITLGSQIVIHGIGVTVSVPASIDFSVSDDTATYSGSWDDESIAIHYYENIVGKSLLALAGSDQYDSATFRFGNTDYTIYNQLSLP